MRRIIAVAVIVLAAVLTTAWSISMLPRPNAKPEIQMLDGAPAKTPALW